MAEMIRTEPLPDGGEKRFYDDGAIVVIGPDGKFAPGGKLPPEAARRRTRAKTAKAALTKSADVDELLSELGLPLDSVACRGLSEQFLDGGSGAVGAIRELLKLSGRATGDEVKRVHDVEFPVKGIVRVDGELYRKMSSDELKRILEDIRILQKQRQDAINVAISDE